MLLGKSKFLYFKLILIRSDLDYSGIESAIDSRFEKKKSKLNIFTQTSHRCRWYDKYSSVYDGHVSGLEISPNYFKRAEGNSTQALQPEFQTEKFSLSSCRKYQLRLCIKHFLLCHFHTCAVCEGCGKTESLTLRPSSTLSC